MCDKISQKEKNLQLISEFKLKKNSGENVNKTDESFVVSVAMTLYKIVRLYSSIIQKLVSGDFPGGVVVRTSPSSAEGVNLIPGWSWS